MGGSRIVISHWHHLIENFHTPPLDFYQRIGQAMDQRQVPETEMSHIDWRESGVFSAKRDYLRVRRGRNVFDICGAPFGTGFFVSWWLAAVRPSPILPTILLFLLSTLLWYVAISLLGFSQGMLAMIVLWIVSFFAVGAFISQGESIWADYVMVIPILGWLLELIFRPVTYYRTDTALMFQAMVNASVQQVIEDLLRGTGLRLLSESERKPIMRDFFGK